jgi:hypothetical protein
MKMGRGGPHIHTALQHGPTTGAGRCLLMRTHTHTRLPAHTNTHTNQLQRPQAEYSRSVQECHATNCTHTRRRMNRLCRNNQSAAAGHTVGLTHRHAHPQPAAPAPPPHTHPHTPHTPDTCAAGHPPCTFRTTQNTPPTVQHTHRHRAGPAGCKASGLSADTTHEGRDCSKARVRIVSGIQAAA